MSKNRYAGLILAAVATTAVAMPLAALAQSNVIAQRQAAMKDVGKAIGALAAILRGEAAYDAAVVTQSSYSIANNLTAAAGLFPAGSTADNSRAKPEIWQDNAKFVEELGKVVEAAKNVAATGDEASFKASFGALGGGCKGCHEPFRKPKE